MSVFQRKLLVILLKTNDLIILSSILFLSTTVYYKLDQFFVNSFTSQKYTISEIFSYLLLLIIWHMVLNLFSLYDSKRIYSYITLFKEIFAAVFTCTVVLLIVRFIFSFSISFKSLLFFLVCNTLIITISRIIYKGMQFFLRKYKRNLRNIVIAGTNQRAVKLAEFIESNSNLGYRLSGFIDDNWIDNSNKKFQKDKLISNFDNFEDFIKDNIIDEVMVCLPVKSYYNQINDLIKVCNKQGVLIKFLNNLFNLNKFTINSETLENNAETFLTGKIHGAASIAKRTMDFFFSLIILIPLFPVFVVISLLIKISSKGPILFKQERIGLNKRIFKIYKFRTMVYNAEMLQAKLENRNEADGPVFKIKNDPRITPFGRFLRKTNIDELPQFINVLTGKMSLVGPRPLPLRDFNKFDRYWYRRRFSIKPGITCFWQIAEKRNLIDFKTWMKLDLNYIDKWSVQLDCRILFKTFLTVFKMTGI